MNRKLLLLHPLLFALFPILFLVAANIRELRLEMAVLPLLSALFLAYAASLFFGLVLQSPWRGALLTSFLTLLFFSYGYIYDSILDAEFFGVVVGRARYLLLSYAALTALSVFIVRKLKGEGRVITAFLNVVASVLVLISLVNIGAYQLNRARTAPPTRYGGEAAIISRGPDASADAMRDIYYIILDAYGRADTLQDFYGYDNSAFISSLSERGFYVASESTSNYSYTQASLASSLNMRYINELAESTSNEEGASNNIDEVLTGMIEENRVQHFLREQGYRLVHFRSIWGPTSRSRFADFHFRGGRLNEFSMLLFNTTLLRASALVPPIYAYVLGDIRERTLYTLDKLAEIPTLDAGGPKFVFAHFLLPHPPFVFGADGGFPVDIRSVEAKLADDGEGWSEEEKRRYIDQVRFTNTSVLELVDALIKKSDLPPIVVIQGDHGPWSTAGKNTEDTDLHHERMRILNSYYLPGGGDVELYERITPVNTFRLILSHYFGADLPLMEDRNYYSNTTTPGQKDRTVFRDVTDIVQ